METRATTLRGLSYARILSLTDLKSYVHAVYLVIGQIDRF
jgi:hypothetical protein